jgi:hypothetical protein
VGQEIFYCSGCQTQLRSSISSVLLHLCGHWEKVQHWRFGDTDWVLDAGHREKDGTFSAIRVGRDSIQIAHWMTDQSNWHEAVIDRKIAARW